MRNIIFFSEEIERITARIVDGVTPLGKRSVCRPITNRINNNMIVYTDGRYLHCRREYAHLFTYGSVMEVPCYIVESVERGRESFMCVFNLIFFHGIVEVCFDMGQNVVFILLHAFRVRHALVD